MENLGGSKIIIHSTVLYGIRKDLEINFAYSDACDLIFI